MSKMWLVKDIVVMHRGDEVQHVFAVHSVIVTLVGTDYVRYGMMIVVIDILATNKAVSAKNG